MSQGTYRTIAQAGPDTSWAMMDWNSGSGTISTWLITPQIDLTNGASLSFYTKTVFNSSYPDRMYIRYSTSGSSTYVGTTPDSLGDFGNQLLVLNEGLVKRGYPEDWTHFIATVPPKGNGVSGRFAFHYYIPDTGSYAFWVAIDTVSILVCPGTNITSPTTGAITGIAIFMRANY